MNVFVPENPTVAVLVINGEIRGVANNISPELNVKVVFTKEAFEAEIPGVPFVKKINLD